MTTITTLKLSANSAIEETDYPGASGILDQNVGLGVTHYLRRNLRLSADGRRGLQDRFEESPRRDRGVGFRFRGGISMMDRNFTFSLAYSLQRRHSSGSGIQLQPQYRDRECFSAILVR